MVLPQIVAFAFTVGVLAVTAVGLIYYIDNQQQKHRIYSNSSYEPSGFDEETNMCTICRDYLSENTGQTLPCKHSFHKDCLYNWVRHNPTRTVCPNCRRQF